MTEKCNKGVGRRRGRGRVIL